MRVVVFLISLCFLLFSGNNHIHANTYYKNNTSYTQGQQNIKAPRVAYSNLHQYSSSARPVNIDKERESIICDDVEDENTESFFAKKCKQQAQGYTIHCWLSYLSILNHLSNTYTAAPSVCSKASPIYILQRVLRI